MVVLDTQLGTISSTSRLQVLGNAVLAWTRCRRGRIFLLSASLMLFGIMMIKKEILSNSYHALAHYDYDLLNWRTHRPHLPAYFTSGSSPLKPSNMTLNIENGQVEHVPSQLTKATPNFHLLMPTLRDNTEFCKTTLSAMILNFPPPTIIGMKGKYSDYTEREKDKLTSVLKFLGSKKVKEEDLMLMVDGMDTWFQLPSHVLIRQYEEVLKMESKRLKKLYGGRFNHTILFGAVKVCAGGECGNVPESTLPKNIYGKETGKEVVITPAKYLDAGMFIGPVGDLKKLYKRAVEVFEKSQNTTVQDVMATIFEQQQLGRKAKQRQLKHFTAAGSLFDWLDTSSLPFMNNGRKREQESDTPPSPPTDSNTPNFEFSIALDYTHTLFQPLSNNAPKEVVAIRHNDPLELSRHHHKDTPTPPLTIPTALQNAATPFWTPGFRNKDSPSPHTESVFIKALQYQADIDTLHDRDTPWSSVLLVQNTYTGAVPATFFHTNSSPSRTYTSPTNSNISYTSLWYSGSERALLRNYFRIAQSPMGYHNMAVGGDREWDQRGGKGGVWTAPHGEWLPWGEVDGVCGTLERLRQTFSDGKGVWLHEKEGVRASEAGRKKEEKNQAAKIEAEKKKVKEKLGKAEKDRKAKEMQAIDKKLKEAEKAKAKAEKKKKAMEDKKRVEAEKKKKADEARRIEEKKKLAEVGMTNETGGE